MIGELAALLAAACWATGSVLFSRIGRGTSPSAMNLGKCAAAGLLLLGTYLAIEGFRWEASPRAALLLGASAVAGLSIGDTAYFGAIVRLGVPRAILLLSGAPVFAAIGSWLFLGEELGARETAGIALTLAGISVTVMRPSGAPVPASVARIGIVLGVISAIGQAAGSVLSKQAMVEGISPLGAASGRLMVGALGLFVGLVVRGHARPVMRELARDWTFARVAAAAMIGSYAGIWLSQIALEKTRSVGVATALLSTAPVFALPLAHFAGERITARAAFGALVAVAGIALLTL